MIIPDSAEKHLLSLVVQKTLVIPGYAERQ